MSYLYYRKKNHLHICCAACLKLTNLQGSMWARWRSKKVSRLWRVCDACFVGLRFFMYSISHFCKIEIFFFYLHFRLSKQTYNKDWKEAFVTFRTRDLALKGILKINITTILFCFSVVLLYEIGPSLILGKISGKCLVLLFCMVVLKATNCWLFNYTIMKVWGGTLQAEH